MKRFLLFILLLFISRLSLADSEKKFQKSLSKDLVAFALFSDSMMIKNSRFLFDQYTPNDSLIFNPDRIRITALILASSLEFKTIENPHFSKNIKPFIRAKHLAVSKNEKPFFIYLLNDFGIQNYNSSNFDQAIQFYQQAISFADSVKNYKGQALSLNNLGFLHQNFGDYDLANNYFLNAKVIAEYHQLNDELYHALNGLCNIQYLIGNYDEAFLLVKEAQKIIKILNKSECLTDNYRKTGKLFFSKKQYEHAINYYLMSLEISKTDAVNSLVASSYNELGVVYLEKQDFKKARFYFDLSLKRAEAEKNQILIVLNQIYIGQVLFATGDLDDALNYYNKAVYLSKSISNLFGLRKAYIQIYRLKKHSNNVTEALKYLELYNEVNNELLDETKLSKISQMQVLFDRTASEKDIKKLTEQTQIFEEETQRQKFNLYTTFAWLMMVIAALFIIVYILRWKIKNNLILQRQNEEITKAHTDLQAKDQELETLNRNL